MAKREYWIPYLFIVPALLILGVFRLFPIFVGLRESFFSVSFLHAGQKYFSGLENYARLLADPVFRNSLTVSLRFNLLINPLQVVLSLGLAFLVNQNVRGIKAFRSLYLIPYAISINVSSLIWRLILDQSGLANGLLAVLGIPSQPFLNSTGQALWSIIGIASWIGVPFWMLFLLAGLQEIPKHLYEAAEIDGASRLQQVFRITLPMMRRSIGFVLISDTISNFLLFVPVYMLTQGGPELSTNLVMFEAYRRGLIYGDFGASSAIVMMQLVIVVAIILLQFYLFRER